MSCLWVTKPELRTAGRRIGLATAGLALVTVGGAGVAAAGSLTAEPIGYSPATDVVAKAPTAVSVTFDEALQAGGAQLRVVAETGQEVGAGAITTSHRTLRRTLQAGAPAGDYTIDWKATSADGHRMSGSFTFTAARSNGAPAFTPSPAQPTPSPVSSPGGTASPAASSTPVSSSTPGSSSSASASPVPSASGGPSTQPSAQSTQLALGQPDFTFPAAPAGATASHGQHRERVAGGFTLVPLIVGALLVVAAGVIAKLNSPRAHA